MPGLLGEIICKIDSKGRMRLPGTLVKQLQDALGTEGTQSFVINRGIEKHLMLYPRKVWEGIEDSVKQLNRFSKKNREFIRFIYRGASEVSPDGQDRILISKPLLEFAGITGTAKLFLQHDRIEIWDAETYDKIEANFDPEDFSDLAEEVTRGFNMINPITKDKDEE